MMTSIRYKNREETKMNHYNTIGIDSQLDWPRIRKLFCIGLFAACLVLAGDMLLGWSVADENVVVLGTFSKYIGLSEQRVFWSAFLGLIGIPLEGLCYFGIYRLIACNSMKLAHIYRSGIFGVLMFGALVHVMCCASVYYLNQMYQLQSDAAFVETLRFAKYFLLPVTGLFLIFFLLLSVTQISAFLKGYTPYPKWCTVFSPFFGVTAILIARVVGNHAITNALSTGWISIGNIWMFGGLLVMMNKAKINSI